MGHATPILAVADVVATKRSVTNMNIGKSILSILNLLIMLTLLVVAYDIYGQLEILSNLRMRVGTAQPIAQSVSKTLEMPQRPGASGMPLSIKNDNSDSTEASVSDITEVAGDKDVESNPTNSEEDKTAWWERNFTEQPEFVIIDDPQNLSPEEKSARQDVLGQCSVTCRTALHNEALTNLILPSAATVDGECVCDVKSPTYDDENGPYGTYKVDGDRLRWLVVYPEQIKRVGD